MKDLKIVVTGKVQGVGFRAFAKKEALRLGLYGYAKNRADGHSVEILLQGDVLLFSLFLQALETGLPKATISHVTHAYIQRAQPFDSFQIL